MYMEQQEHLLEFQKPFDVGSKSSKKSLVVPSPNQKAELEIKEKVNCRVCDKEILIYKGMQHKTYCSNKCRYQGKNYRNVIFYCVHCKKKVPIGRRKFCSDYCNRKYHFLTHKEEYLKRMKEYQLNNQEKRKKTSRESARRCLDYYKPNICKICQKDIIRDTYRKKKYCYECVSNLEKQRNAHRVKIRHKAKRQAILEALDGKCIICGYVRTLEVHHFYEVKSKLKRNWSAYYKQLERGEPLILLCPNHHTLCHKKLLSLDELNKMKDYIKKKYGK